jgi:hypothetical protein
MVLKYLDYMSVTLINSNITKIIQPQKLIEPESLVTAPQRLSGWSRAMNLKGTVKEKEALDSSTGQAVIKSKVKQGVAESGSTETSK